MATFTDLIQEAEYEVKTAYDKKEWWQVVTDIEFWIAELNGTGVSSKSFQNYTADELSIIWGRLATLQASLTQHRVEAFRQIQITNQYIKVKTASLRPAVKSSLIDEAVAKKEKAPTADDIWAEVDRQLTKVNLVKAFHETEYEKLQSYRYAIPNILYRIEQRINFIIGDRGTSKFMKGADEEVIPEIGRKSIDFGNVLD